MHEISNYKTLSFKQKNLKKRKSKFCKQIKKNQFNNFYSQKIATGSGRQKVLKVVTFSDFFEFFFVFTFAKSMQENKSKRMEENQTKKAKKIFEQIKKSGWS